MPVLAADCPRCGSKKMTFDVKSYNDMGRVHNWKRCYELFSVCRNCFNATTFVVVQRSETASGTFDDPKKVMEIKGSLNIFFTIEHFVSLHNSITHHAPDFIPDNIKAAFDEGATCLSTQCWNAAGAMFRTCLDLTTKDMLPQEKVEGLEKRHRENLAARIDWFFENNKLPERLRELADCVRQDGNDGAHDGTLGEMEAIDLLEFTVPILEHFYTQPEKIKRTGERRAERRKKLTEGEGEEQSEAKGEEQTA